MGWQYIIIVALLRTLLGLIPVSLLCWAFFGYSIYSLGLPLLAFFVILQMFSWSIGLAMFTIIMPPSYIFWGSITLGLPITTLGFNAD